jgi:hypothetical protein
MTSGRDSNEASPQCTFDALLLSRLAWLIVTRIELILLNEAYTFNFSSKELWENRCRNGTVSVGRPPNAIRSSAK